jgi:hypothetical protein
MAPETELGHVRISERDQFITKLASGETGVEVRDAELHVSADSRIRPRHGVIPAVSWNHDFQSVTTTLHLPPGWRLFHASGADDVPGTWLRRWTLLDLFLLLLASLAAGRLFGPIWGVVTLVTLALTLKEFDAPRWLFLALLAGEALVRALPQGPLVKWARAYRFATAVALVLVTVLFLMDNVRRNLYPAQERPYDAISYNEAPPNSGTVEPAESVPRPAPEAPPPVQQNALAEDADQESRANLKTVLSGERTRQLSKKRQETIQILRGSGGYGMVAKEEMKAKLYANRQAIQDVDRSVVVQTGPGLPQWQWDRIAIQWNGPVNKGQRLHLYYLSPVVNLVLALLRMLLLATLVVRFLPLSRVQWSRWLGRPTPPAAAGLLLAVSLGLLPGSARAELPSQEWLDQLEERLTTPPECHPHCATSARMALEATPTALTIRLEVQAAANVAVPLPGHADQWVPEGVLVDGRPAPGLSRSEEGVLWLPLQPGTHQIVLQGSLPGWESVQVALPLRPHRVVAKLSGWTLAGLHEDGLADADLQLTRIRGSAKPGAPLQSAKLPPFVRVSRDLSLALDWEVNTMVERASPLGSAIVLEIPLLPGEAVTTPEIRVAEGKALVNLGAQVQSVTWHSTLPRATRFQLTAPQGLAWVENWRLDVSPLWHVRFSGLPPVHRQSDQGEQVPHFRPWPGESLSLEIERPSGVVGQTLTVDQTELHVTPGLRATRVELRLDLRSSHGGQHTIRLPEGAELHSVRLNNEEQPVPQEGRNVTLPTVPGAQKVVLDWGEPRGMGVWYHPSEVDLGVPTVNAHTVVQPPSGRWVLLTGGPRLGPSVLFWSTLVVFLLVSWGLSRTRLAPLRVHEWMLLSLGLSQVPVPAAAIVAGWLLFFGWRGRDVSLPRWVFNGRQLIAIAWSGAALLVLAQAVRSGLLGRPDMQLGGNGSTPSMLRWFQDRTGPQLSSVWVLSVPVTVYRLAMLAWALWLARALLRWLRWGWNSFTSGGLWKPSPPKAAAAPAPPA